MKLHGSAALSQRQRRRLVVLVGSGMTIAAAAAIVGCSRQTGSKWVNRHRRGEGLEDRSSWPRRSPRRVPDKQVEQAVLRARVELRGRTARHRLGDRRRGLDRARDLAPQRLLEAQSRASRAARLSSATSASGRASSSTST